MNKLNRNFFLCIAIGALGLVGCKNDKEETNYEEYTDARIIKFNLVKSDTLYSDWEKVFFSIDQAKGEVFNNDSLPKGTKVNKVLTKIEYASASKVLYKKLSLTLTDNIEEWKEYNNTDSLDFTTPLVFQITALDKKTTKEYVVRVNVHTQDPDSLHWRKISSNRLPYDVISEKSVLLNDTLFTLAKSTNGSLALFVYTNFEQTGVENATVQLPSDVDIETLTASDKTIWVSSFSGKLFKYNGSYFELVNTPETVKLIGWIGKSQNNNPRLVLQTTKNNPLFATYKTETQEWTLTKQPLPYGFPENGTGKTTHNIANSSRLTLVGGTFMETPSRKIFQFMIDQDTLQCSEDLLSSITPSTIALRETTGNSSFIYDNRMFTFEGYPYYTYTTTIDKNEVRITSNRLVYSRNGGISWVVAPTKESLPNGISLRSHCSIVVDQRNYIWIIGGVDKEGNHINDLWKGRINRLGYNAQ